MGGIVAGVEALDARVDSSSSGPEVTPMGTGAPLGIEKILDIFKIYSVEI
jgi:hypothetical protein